MSDAVTKWPIVNLGMFADFRNGLNFSKEGRADPVYIVGVGDFQDKSSLEGVSSLSQIRPDGPLADEDLIRDGDFLFVRSNGNKALIGRCVHITGLNGHPVTFSGFTIRARLRNGGLHPGFAKHALRSNLFKAHLHELGGGSNISNLTQDILSSFEIRLPSLHEQRRIAAILDEWDKAIATLEKLVGAKKKRQSAVLSAVFANAPKRPLYEIADVIMGQSPPSSAYREPGTGQLPLVQGAADFSGGLVVAKSDTDIVTKSVDQPCIVMSVRAPVGTIARLAFPACLGRGVCALVPKDDLGLDYIASVVTGLSPYWATMAQGSSFEAVSGEIIRDALVPYGTPDFVRDSALVFQMVSQELNQEVERTRALRLQKRGLMQKLLSGDLPVPASIDRLLPGGLEVDEAVGAEVQRAEATG